MKHLLPPRSLLALLILLGCGVTVGNSGPPSVTGDPDAGTDTASLVGLQHDEVMNAAADSNANDAKGLALLADPVIASTCTEEAGSLLVERSETLDASFDIGSAARRRTIRDALERKASIKLSLVSGIGVLKCGDNNRPDLSFAQLINLKSEETVTRDRNRSVVLKADNSVLSQTTLKATSKREHVFAKVSGSILAGGTLIVSKTSSFDSTVQVQKQDGTEAKERKIQTLPNEPLVLERSLRLTEGVTAARIVSGAVMSVNDEQKKVVLRYSNLELALGSSCHPTSGSIAGEIFADASATTAESTFTLNFTADGAMLVHADGTEEELELEACKL